MTLCIVVIVLFISYFAVKQKNIDKQKNQYSDDDFVSADKLEEPIIYSFPKNYAVIDIETTGLNYKDERIVEISAIKIRNREIQETAFDAYVSNAHVSPWLKANSEITQKMVLEKGGDFKDVMTQFKDFIGDDVLVGHNIGFDINFIRKYYKHFGLGQLSNKYVDTMLIGKYYANPEWENHKVSDYIENNTKINPKNLSQHMAIHDVEIENNIFNLEREILGENWVGQHLVSANWALPDLKVLE